MDWQKWSNISTTTLSRFFTEWVSLIDIYQIEDIGHSNGLYWKAQKKNQSRNKPNQSKNVAKTLGIYKTTTKLQNTEQWEPYQNFLN